ncbi:tripartite tricarboxylate transporter TctB family protein [Neorhizobium galegae]|uniref:tripartite tricarboxylate transporter TctB family protein n=1 Tax=Neorhizobium galegae TaxID=399 RepID=UPI001F27EFF7|nr:tripartite tricarboxylate transporter TctB family protein [Neorhizobium galegae]UIK04496.1 tripartite tricarboxylate transporter TctB family protein [Neorhizobium galegae]
MNSLKFDTANLICGLLLVATGLFFAYQSFELELGTALRMGPGYFPFILACALILFGALILFQSMRVDGGPIGALALRGMVFILPAPIFFGLTVRGLGFVPSIFVTALIASFASGRMKPLTALVLSAALTVFSVAVFSYGLGLPFRRFGPWLGY